MSDYEATAQAVETEQQAQKGEESFLSTQERQQLKRFLGYPEDFPAEFKEWLIDFMAVNIPLIPLSQIIGFGRFEDGIVTPYTTAKVVGAEARNNAAYGALTTALALTALPAGDYLLMYGCDMDVQPAEAGFMSVSINGAAASDDDACRLQYDTGAGGAVHASVATVKFVTVSDVVNTVTTQYRTTGSISFQRRWIVALKIGS